MKLALAYIKALYDAHGTVYRLTWTAIQTSAGLAAGIAFSDPTIGVLVGALAVVLTSEARKRLASG